MTAHISAKKDQIAKTVLMPGDPLRAKFIAENFLEDVKEVNNVRNMLMFTGKYKGKEVTIAGSGMGQPSIGIYSYELFNFYDVENIIRIGSAGSYKSDLKLYDLVLATSAYSESNVYALNLKLDAQNILEPSKNLNDKIIKKANTLNINLNLGQIHSSDVFYSYIPLEERIKKSNSICVEMESYALFANAKKLNKNAACLLTISDNLITNEETSSAEREKKFTKMVELALESLL